MTPHVLISPGGVAHFVRPGVQAAACGVHPGARPWSRDVDEWRVRSVRLWPVASRRCSSCIACLDAGYGPGKETA